MTTTPSSERHRASESEAGERLLARLQESWTDAAFVDVIAGRSFTYGEVWTAASALKVEWEETGAVAGDAVLLQAAAGPIHLVAHLAAAMGGFVLCPLPRRAPAELVEHARNWARPTCELVEVASGEALPHSMAVVTSAPRSVRWPRGEGAHGLFFSSGTTGEPKGICLSRDGFFGSAALYGEAAGFDRETRLLHVLPMGYMAGLVNTLFATFMAGGTVVSSGEFTPFSVGRLWDWLHEHGVNVLSLFPSIASLLCDLEGKSSFRRLGAPENLVVHSTSAPVSPRVRERFSDTFGLEILNCYGITELGGPLTLQRRGTDDDAGYPFPRIEVALSPGAPMAPLRVRSPHRMLGYLEAPFQADRPIESQLRSTADAEGFIQTGDLASLDEDGVLTVHGRADDVINKGGLKIAPFNVEAAIRRVDGVEDVAVFGAADPRRGQRIVACVAAPRSAWDAVPGRVGQSAAVRAALGSAALDDIYLYRQLPKSHLGKTLKRRLRQDAARRLTAGEVERQEMGS